MDIGTAILVLVVLLLLSFGAGPPCDEHDEY
jgi:hypothetical protein